VVPADRKPVRNLVIAELVVEALERLNPGYPEAPPELEKLRQALSNE
jgi:hypothetical protein